MCRWIYYYGEEVCISKLIYGASHGLATMADRAGWTPGCARDAERNHEVNVHGCGACVFERARHRRRRRASCVVARRGIVVRDRRARALCGCARERARVRDLKGGTLARAVSAY